MRSAAERVDGFARVPRGADEQLGLALAPPSSVGTPLDSGIGRVIDGKYELIASIGRGGMSVVWLGRDRRLEKLWAVKEIKPDVAGRQGQANRQAIVDEANFMKRLDHPAIPRVVDIVDTGASIFVVMDYVNGRPLSKVLRQQGTPFSQEEVVGWGIELCDVLSYLHGIRPPDGYPVVYRDMKPSNVMLRDDGSVRVIDFGIAMELLPSGPSDTRAIGTVGYGAPEQVDPDVHRELPVDARADIYALGATLYSLVTGHVPRTRDDGRGGRSVDFRMRPIRAWDPRLSDGLERILLRATRPDPAERYQTAEEMRFDLERYEELTDEWRAAQQAKVTGFWRRVRLAGAAAALGAACLAGSALLRSSSYEALMHEASVAATEEVIVTAPTKENGFRREAMASEAERDLARAIELAPGNAEPYEALLRVYQADRIFTPTESRRWLELWQAHGRALQASERYARLCYDVGILYLSYYDYLGVKDGAHGSDDAASGRGGQGAIQSAARSAEWFSRAKAACDPAHGYYAGLEVGEALDEYAALEAYETIGAFHNAFTTASIEGRDVAAASGAFFESLVAAIVGTGGADPAVLASEKIVQLRLYQVAFESLASPTYLSGFRRAGVCETEAMRLLETIQERLTTPEFRSYAEATKQATGAMYQELVGGYEDARENVRRTYNSPVSRMREGSGESEG